MCTFFSTLLNMTTDDLFSFLDNKPPSDDDDLDEDADGDVDPEAMETDTVERSRKRKTLDRTSSHPDSQSESEDLVKENGLAHNDEPAHKKTRVELPPDSIVVDDFETEAKREVAANAGLTGAVEAGSRLELRHQVRHQVAVPPGYNYIPISEHVPPAKPAREYKFTLDPFQQVSVYAIQRNESVLVSAHTSAGKTVVAEYAIAQCLQSKQRVVYTSPIKVRQILA